MVTPTQKKSSFGYFWLIFAKMADFERWRSADDRLFVFPPNFPQYMTFIVKKQLYTENNNIWLVLADF